MQEDVKYRNSRIKISVNFLGSLIITDLSTLDFVIFRDWEEDVAGSQPGVRALRDKVASRPDDAFMINDVKCLVNSTTNRAIFKDVHTGETVRVSDDEFLALLSILSAYYD